MATIFASYETAAIVNMLRGKSDAFPSLPVELLSVAGVRLKKPSCTF